MRPGCGQQQRVPGQEWALGTRCHLWSTLQSPGAPEFMGLLTNCLPTRNPRPKTEGWWAIPKTKRCV